MIGAVHAAIGAAVGRLAGHQGRAFAAGVATHLLGDLTPHKDFPIQIEAPLLLGVLGLIAWRCGLKSPEFWGAVGGFIPDVENAAYVVGILPQDKLRFPTHVGGGTYHAPKTRSVLPQAILALVCLFFALRSSSKRKP